MGSRRGTLGTQQERSGLARAKLIDATIALIGEQGFSGFSVSDVGRRAGLGRALAGHHFKSSKALIRAAAMSLLQDDSTSMDPGLSPLLGWIEAQLGRAAARDPRLIATLQVALGPGALEVQDLKEEYWRRECGRIQQQLTSARALHQVDPDLDPTEAASSVLGMLHGEQLRIIATGQPPGPTLLVALQRALAAGTRQKTPQKGVSTKSARLDLFGEA